MQEGLNGRELDRLAKALTLLKNCEEARAFLDDIWFHKGAAVPGYSSVFSPFSFLRRGIMA